MCSICENKRLRARIAELEANNRRYLYLQRCAKIISAKMNGNHYWQISTSGWPGLHGASLNAAIDAAIDAVENEKAKRVNHETL